MRKIKKVYTDLSEVFINGMYKTDKILAKRFGEAAGQKFWARHLEVDSTVFRELLRGKISEDEYWVELMRGRNFPFTIEEAKQAFGDNMKLVVPGTLQLYQRIISGAHRAVPHSPSDQLVFDGKPEIYILSDHIVERLPEIHDEHPDVFSIVDRCFWSCFMGKIKQDEGFFDDVLDITGDRPDEVIFIDDNPQNVAAAEKAGIKSFTFTSAAQLERDLDRFGLQFS